MTEGSVLVECSLRNPSIELSSYIRFILRPHLHSLMSERGQRPKVSNNLLRTSLLDSICSHEQQRMAG